MAKTDGGNKVATMEKLTYTVMEAGDLLGLSRATAYNLVHKGVIPTIRLGRQLKVPRVQLEKLLNGKPEGTPDANATSQKDQGENN
jgi:excisionase family DNA binding protein